MKRQRLFTIVYIGAALMALSSVDLSAALPDSEKVPTQSFKTLFADIAAKATPSIVSVLLTKIDTVTLFKNPFYYFFGDSLMQSPFEFFSPPNSRHGRGVPGGPGTERRRYREQDLGSGVIISTDGYILTNYHVVAGADEIQVKLANDQSYPAKVIGIDSLADVAVIKITDPSKQFPAANLGDDSKLRAGDWVMAIGNPFSLTSTVTVGIVSALHRHIANPTLYQNYIQTDAAINPGNSGGALVNIEGQVVGINTMIYTETGGFMGIGFAIPMTMAKKVMGDLITLGRVVRGWIGVTIQDIDESTRTALNLGNHTGILIATVYKGEPADRAGIKPGDVVMAMAGKKVESSNQLRNFVAELKPGVATPVSIFRYGKELTLHLTVEERNEGQISRLSVPAALPPAVRAPERVFEKRFGISLANLTADLREKFSIAPLATGVLVVATDDSLSDARGELREGDLIERVKAKDKDFLTVLSLKQFDAVTRLSQKGDPLLLMIRRGVTTFFVAFKDN